MNVCYAVVTKLLSPPYQRWGLWLVNAEVNCYGNITEKVLAYPTEASAKTAHVGMWVTA